MKKKISIILVLLMVVALALTGCGGQKEAAAPVPKGANR